MEVLSKFSLYTGLQKRTTYRIVKTVEDMFRIEEYVKELNLWRPVYRKMFTKERELLSSVQFKKLFIPQWKEKQRAV